MQLRAKGDLRALVVVANPVNLSEYDLDIVDVHGEMERARQGLEDIPVTTLPDKAGKQKATLNNLFDQLREHEFDILYIALPWDFTDNGSLAVAGRRPGFGQPYPRT